MSQLTRRHSAEQFQSLLGFVPGHEYVIVIVGGNGKQGNTVGLKGTDRVFVLSYLILLVTCYKNMVCSRLPLERKPER